MKKKGKRKSRLIRINDIITFYLSLKAMTAFEKKIFHVKFILEKYDFVNSQKSLKFYP